MNVRVLVDIVIPGGRVQHGEACEVPDTFGMGLIDQGWAELLDGEPLAVRVAVQTPQEHATALRQRRRITWP